MRYALCIAALSSFLLIGCSADNTPVSTAEGTTSVHLKDTDPDGVGVKRDLDKTQIWFSAPAGLWFEGPNEVEGTFANYAIQDSETKSVTYDCWNSTETCYELTHGGSEWHAGPTGTGEGPPVRKTVHISGGYP